MERQGASKERNRRDLEELLNEGKQFLEHFPDGSSSGQYPETGSFRAPAKEVPWATPPSDLNRPYSPPGGGKTVEEEAIPRQDKQSPESLPPTPHRGKAGGNPNAVQTNPMHRQRSVEELLREAQRNLIYVDMLEERESVRPPSSAGPKPEEPQRPSAWEGDLRGAPAPLIPPYRQQVSQVSQKSPEGAPQMSELIQQLLTKAQELSEKQPAVISVPASSVSMKTEPTPPETQPDSLEIEPDLPETQQDSPETQPAVPTPELEEALLESTSILAEWFPSSPSGPERTKTQENSFEGPSVYEEMAKSEDKEREGEPTPPSPPSEPDKESPSLSLEWQEDAQAPILPPKKTKGWKQRRGEGEKPRAHREEHGKKKRRGLITSLLSLAAFCGAVIIVLQFYGIAIVQGASMSPSLDEKDMVFFSKHTGGLQRGDIVILRYEQELIVKRIVGVPGDLVEVDQDGYVLLNGKRLEGETALYGRANINGDVSFPIQVEEGHYFLLGDNRPVSLDSRMSVIGQVPQKDIVGEVISWIHIE